MLLGLQQVQALSPIILSDQTAEACIARKYAGIFEDTSAKLTIKDILIPTFKRRFRTSKLQTFVNQNTSSAYWFQFEIIKSHTSNAEFRIEIFDFDIDEISFFYPDSNGMYHEQKAGFTLPFEERKVAHKNVSFHLPLQDNERATFYMRFRSKKQNVLEPMIRSYTHLLPYWLNEYMLLGVFYGLVLLTTFYNLINFIILKRSYYFYFVLYCSGVLAHIMNKNGTGFQYLWPNRPYLNNFMTEIGLLISTTAMLLFFQTFFELKTTNPRWSKIITTALLIRLVIYPFQLLSPNLFFSEILSALYVEFAFACCISLYHQGMRSTRWPIIAFSILTFALMVTGLEQTNVIGSNIFTVYITYPAIVLQFLFLSIGIAENVRQVHIEKNEAQTNLIILYQQNEALKDKVNRELEQKVAERTKQLHTAKLELEKKAEENMHINIALDIANNKLQRYLNTFAQTVVSHSHLDLDSFKKAFPDDFSCQRYLVELKEKNGFSCKMCGNTKAIKGKEKFDVRCSKCDYNESLTANTIFHKTKFSLQKAFYMLYLVSQTKTDIPASELAKMLELQKTTCQNFKDKIFERMSLVVKKSKRKHPEWDYLIIDRETA